MYTENANRAHGQGMLDFAASTGDTFPAILPGRKQENITVIKENNAAPRKISGELLREVLTVPRVVCSITTGVRTAPVP